MPACAASVYILDIPPVVLYAGPSIIAVVWRTHHRSREILGFTQTLCHDLGSQPHECFGLGVDNTRFPLIHHQHIGAATTLTDFLLTFINVDHSNLTPSYSSKL
jgi:hypothetical protein